MCKRPATNNRNIPYSSELLIGHSARGGTRSQVTLPVAGHSTHCSIFKIQIQVVISLPAGFYQGRTPILCTLKLLSPLVCRKIIVLYPFHISLIRKLFKIGRAKVSTPV